MEKEYFELDTSKPIISKKDIEECLASDKPKLVNPDEPPITLLSIMLEKMRKKQGNIKLQ